jgi:hypothetical protein
MRATATATLPLLELIERHRVTAQAHDAKCLDPTSDDAEVTRIGDLERELALQLLGYPCTTIEQVRLKASYMVSDTQTNSLRERLPSGAAPARLLPP